MENAGVMRCSGQPTEMPAYKRRFRSASSTRTTASRLAPNRPGLPRRCGLSPAAWGRRRCQHEKREPGRIAGLSTGVSGRVYAMETVIRFEERQQVGSVSILSTPSPEVPRTLSVTAGYLLSEDGRKASLLAGGDGRAVQEISLQVPANRLHLVSVDKHGLARLKLRPRFERDENRGLTRIDAAPIYDAPPTIDELYRAAAHNHELEAVYYAERSMQRSKRRDDDRVRRETAAEAFLADKGQRAVAHPPPSPQRCY